MYKVADIKGSKEEFIIQKACEWIALNSEIEDIDEVEYARLDNRYCFIRYNHVYRNAYDHTAMAGINELTKYLLIAGQIHIENGKIRPHNCILIDVEKNQDILLNQSFIQDSI